MAEGHHRDLGAVFNQVPELYDRMRPTYPAELLADFAATAEIGQRSSIVEVGCGTGQATGALAALGCSVLAIEPGPAMFNMARQRLSSFASVQLEQATFEEWDDANRCFDALVAAASWHWVDQVVGWPKAHRVVRPGGWMALIGHVVVRQEGEPEMYAMTEDLHEQFAPGNPNWCHPPLEAEVRGTNAGWGPNTDPLGLFGETIVSWYPTEQWFDGTGLADFLRTNSMYRCLDSSVREPLLDAVAARVRTHLDDRVCRRYLAVMRIGQRT